MNSKIANSIFRYDAESGSLYWKVRPHTRVAVGDEIKTVNTRGYIIATYKSKKYPVHRIIWLMVYGKFPDGQIDHADHDRTNNKLDNLRDVDNSTNQRNTKIPTNNTSGFIGVHFCNRDKRWIAKGRNSDRIRKHIGSFDTKEEAIEARKTFNRENGYHPNHGK